MSNGRPGPYTSNYGWALWHLNEAQNAAEVQSFDAAQYHLGAAQARATLYRGDVGATGYVEKTTWGAYNGPQEVDE